MISPITLEKGKKVFFASDFHLGAPNKEESLARERNIVSWLQEISEEAAAIFILGDIFDFWFEYKYTIPKGFIRLQGKLAELRDKGIPIYFFTGNHDMWMFDYFPSELGIPIYRKPQDLVINNAKFLIGHGDGLGPGDHIYKILKKIFANKLCQFLFSITPPAVGMGIAQLWSKKSRLHNESDEVFLGDKEWLYIYCKEIERDLHHDYYIFGHRHLPLDLAVNEHSRYLNLGEWIQYYTFASFDGEKLALEKYIQ